MTASRCILPAPSPTCVPPRLRGGVIIGDPGVAGLWVARTFPTTEPGTIVVPAIATAGIAAALALVAALRGLPAVAVTTEPLDPTTLGVLELATELGATLAIDVWGAGGPVRRAEDHLEQLGARGARARGDDRRRSRRRLAHAQARRRGRPGRGVGWPSAERVVPQPGRADASMPSRSDNAE